MASNLLNLEITASPKKSDVHGCYGAAHQREKSPRCLFEKRNGLSLRNATLYALYGPGASLIESNRPLKQEIHETTPRATACFVDKEL